MAADADKTRQRIDRQIRLVDETLLALDRRRMDPIKVLQKAIERHDKRHQAAQSKGA